MLSFDRDQAERQAQQRIDELRRFKALGLVPLNGDFFTTVAYPPLKSYAPVSEEDFFKGYVPPADGIFSIYAHIPFCARRCNFCHIPAICQPEANVVEDYLAAMESEMDLHRQRLGVSRIKTRAILLGGGTPTQLSPEQLERFLKSFTARLDLSGMTQFSVDAEPSSLLGELGLKRLRLMRSYGVNRVCVGVDCFDDILLQAMNRGYSARQAAEAARSAKDLGYSVNIEFIYGYPGQSLESWIATMETAIGLGMDEIQLYRLKVIPYKGFEGAITRQFAADPKSFPSDEAIVRLKQWAHSMLKDNGYAENRYRVFARDPRAFSHYADSLAFALQDLISLGVTAWSSLRDRLSVNCHDLKDYHAALAQGRLPIRGGRVRTSDEQLRWAYLLPLRIRELDRKSFQCLTGRPPDGLFPKKVERLKSFGLIEEDKAALRLTELGRFFAGDISFQFYHPSQMPFPPSAFAQAPLNPYNDPEP
jgi:oxygen-independent coproporphyrinogen-3 oxidase